jgi:hypothetical protein
LQDGEPLGFVLSNVVTLKRQVRSFSEEVTEVTPPLPALPNLKTEREDPFDQMVRGVTPDRGEDFYSFFFGGDPDPIGSLFILFWEIPIF